MPPGQRATALPDWTCCFCRGHPLASTHLQLSPVQLYLTTTSWPCSALLHMLSYALYYWHPTAPRTPLNPCCRSDALEAQLSGLVEAEVARVLARCRLADVAERVRWVAAVHSETWIPWAAAAVPCRVCSRGSLGCSRGCRRCRRGRLRDATNTFHRQGCGREGTETRG